ncbi:MAG: LacI family DNA-binding transcriptional regulator [Microbacteriaceae bacterium]
MSVKPRPTYSAIAKAAGVSEATVSRVLNGDDRVNPERTAAVLKVVEELGYRKNRAATALASGRTGLIAVVIDDDLSVFADPFWGTVTSGISRVLMENHLQTVLMVTPVNRVDGPVAHYLESREVDGAIFFQLHKDALVRKLAKQGLPIVITGSPHTDADLIFVDTDNFGGGYAATKHLINRGCKKVAVITGDIETTAGHQRLDGYNQVYREFGRVPSKSLVKHGDYSFESGQAQMRQLLADNPDVDGVFACNDLMALGAIAVIEESGRSVPNDVAVIGFDDSIMARTSRPALSSVRQDIAALGEAAAQLMIAQLNGEAAESRIMPVELVLRESA